MLLKEIETLWWKITWVELTQLHQVTVSGHAQYVC